MSTDPDAPGVPVLEELGRRFEASLEGESSYGSFTPRLRLAVAGWVTALVALTALTPTGRAVAEDVAEFVGITNVEIDRGEFSGELGSGTIAGQPYLVTVSGDIGETGETCIFVTFVNAEGSDIGSCQGEGFGEAIAENTVLPFLYRPAEGVVDRGAMIQTLSTPDVDRLEVTYEQTDGQMSRDDMQRFALPEQAVERLGLPSSESASFFLAVLPGTLPANLGDPGYDAAAERLTDSIKLTAYDVDGDVVAERELTQLADPPDFGNYDSRLDQRRFGTVEDSG